MSTAIERKPTTPPANSDPVVHLHFIFSDRSRSACGVPIGEHPCSAANRAYRGTSRCPGCGRPICETCMVAAAEWYAC